MSYDDFRTTAINQVKAELGHETWFEGVCTDGLVNYYPNIDEAVNHCINQTIYWDGNWNE